AIVPPLLARTIAGHGWRAGYYTLGATALIGLLPLLMLVRLPAPSGETPPGASDATFNAPELHRAPVFWMLMAAFATLALGFAGLLLLFVPMLTDFCVAPVRACAHFAHISNAVVVSRCLVGLLMIHVFV